MAKTTKPKQKAGVNPRSRAAKRATSPSVNLDKSLADAPRASDATPLLGPNPRGGIQKPSSSRKKIKPMKRGQRARAERGLARAEIVNDRLEKKHVESQVRLKKVRGRRAIWEEINEEVMEEKRKMPRFEVLDDNNGQEDGNAEGDDEEWEDEQGDAEMKVVDGVVLPASAVLTKIVVPDRTASSVGSEFGDIT